MLTKKSPRQIERIRDFIAVAIKGSVTLTKIKALMVYWDA
jgi:hypothetical protein